MVVPSEVKNNTLPSGVHLPYVCGEDVKVESQSGNSVALQNFRNNVEKLFNHKSAVWFREPVDWKTMNILDYPEKVKNPMDLGTIMKKLDNSEYNTVEEGASDIRLVFENCLSYNRPSSAVYSAAENLYQKFEAMHVKDFPGQFNFKRSPTLEEKQRLTKDLARVTEENLRTAVSILEARPGVSIDVKTDSELVINVETIPRRTFWEMYRYLRRAIQEGVTYSKRKIPHRVVDAARFGITRNREGFLSPGLMSGHEAIKEWPGGMDVLNALKDVAMSRRPVSASTVSRACKIIVSNIREYKHVVHMVEKFLKRIRPEERVPVAYVIDAVVKDSRAKNGDKDPFDGRFALRMTSSTLPTLGEVPSGDRELLYKLVKNWARRGRFGLRDADVLNLKESWAEGSPSGGLRSPNIALLSEEDEVPAALMQRRRVKRPENLRESSSDGNAVPSVCPSPPVPSTMRMSGQAMLSQEIAVSSAAAASTSTSTSEAQPQADLISLLEMSETAGRSSNDLYSSGQTRDRGFVSWGSREGSSRTVGGPNTMHSELDPHNNTHQQQQQHPPSMVLPVEQKGQQQQHLWQGDQQQRWQIQKPQGMWPTNEPSPRERDQKQQILPPPSMHRQQVWQSRNQNQQQHSWLANIQPQQEQKPLPWQQNQHTMPDPPPLSCQQQQKWPQTNIEEQMEGHTGQKMEKLQPSGHKLETDQQPKKRQRKSRSRWDQEPAPAPAVSQPPPPSSIMGTSRGENVSTVLSSSQSSHASQRRVCIPPNVPSPRPPFPPHLPHPSAKIAESATLPQTGLSPQPTNAMSSSLLGELPNGVSPSGPPQLTASASSLPREFPSGVNLRPGPPSAHNSSFPSKPSVRIGMHLGPQSSISTATTISSLPGEVPSGVQVHPRPPSQLAARTSSSKDYVSSGVGRSSHPLPAGLPMTSAVASATGLSGGDVVAVSPRGLPIDSSHPPPQTQPKQQHQKVNGEEEVRFPLKNKMCRNISKNKPCIYGQNCHFLHNNDESKTGFRIILGEADNGGGSGGGLPIPVGDKNNQIWRHTTAPVPPRPPFLGSSSGGRPSFPVLPPPPPHVHQFHLAQGSSQPPPPPPPSVVVPPGQVMATSVYDDSMMNENEEL